jgi:hypothetical protein
LFSEHYYSISAHNEKREAIFPVSFLYNDFWSVSNKEMFSRSQQKWPLDYC